MPLVILLPEPSVLFNKKGTKKVLSLILDEDEDIFNTIKQGMQEQKLSEAKIEGIEGKIKEGTVAFMNGSRYKTKNLSNAEVLLASGAYKLSFEELFGVVHLTLAGKPPLSATLVKGKACNGLKVRLSFIELEA